MTGPSATTVHVVRGISRCASRDPGTRGSATGGAVEPFGSSKFGSIDALVNNAGIYFSKRFTDYTLEDLRSLASVNIEGFFFISQLAIRRMIEQKSGGSIVNITSTMVDHPIAGVNAAVPMLTKGGLRQSPEASPWNTRSRTYA